ncbi:hypothetical protein [Ruegeria sp. R14_0]|uniref:hypothetical protein n=1 Tax=Ruegeria sp. R14_0 TaxID=2821100 RepID=UPI001ADAD7E7|nr:hypothetical protein [Ruegeria sp. R14_0]MBO9445731.1 hypothetical protein [Ruegeria sp. R14_0]
MGPIKTPPMPDDRMRQQAYEIAADLRWKIRAHHSAGNVRKTVTATRGFFNSTICKTAYVFKVRPDIEFSNAQMIAQRIDPFKKLDAPIRWFKQQKYSGGWRPVCMYTTAEQAAQKMIADALAAQWVRPSNLFGAKSGDPKDKGYGRDAAARQVQRLLQVGYTYVATADIKDAFGSVDPDALYSLPLSKGIIAQKPDLRNQHLKEVDPPKKEIAPNQRGCSSELGEDRVRSKYLIGWKDGKSPRRQDHAVSEQDAQTRRGAGIHQPYVPLSSARRKQAQALAPASANHNHAPMGWVEAVPLLRDSQEVRHTSGIALGTIPIPYVDSDIQSELCPTGIAQGSAASPIIFAMLLAGLPNALDDARYLVCHDDIIILARTPEARSSMILALVDFFAGQCRAGSLTMDTRLTVDGEPFEWLGYAFDPSRVKHPEGGIGVGDRSFSSLAARLNTAEIEDLRDLEKYGVNRASAQTCGFPIRTWHTLRQWRSGCRAVHPGHEDLAVFVEGSRWVAERYAAHFQNRNVSQMHDAIFEEETPNDGVSLEVSRRLRSILFQFPLISSTLTWR